MRITIDFDSKLSRRVVRVGAAMLVACAVGYPVFVLASPTGTLVSFTAGTTIRAADFNANFAALKRASDDNDTRIGSLSGLTTTAKGNLVAAINEAKLGTTGPQGATGPQGVQGIQGIPGPTQFFVVGIGVSGSGGGTNAWTAGASFAGPSNVGPFAGSQVSGKPYTAVVRVITSDATTGLPGNALAPGNLTIDLTWNFVGGHAGAGAEPVNVKQTLGSIVIAAGANDKTGTFTGTVPTAITPNGYPGAGLGGFGLSVNATTTAQGQSANSVLVTIGP